MKKTLGGVAFALFLLSGCLSAVDRDVSLSPENADVLNSNLVLRQEVVIIRLRSGRKGLFLQPYGAINNIVPRKDEMRPVPFRFDKVLVEGVVPAGTTMRVTRMIEDNNFEDSSLGVIAEVVTSPNASIVGKTLRVDSLLTEPHPSGKPSFNPALVNLGR